MCRRVLLLIAALAILAPGSAAQGLAPYPAWAVQNPFPPFDPADIYNPPGSSSAWSAVPDRFETGFTWGSFEGSKGGPWIFTSQSASGVIAVETYPDTQVGGIATGFTDILFMKPVPATPVSKFPGKDELLIWSGRKANGKWGIGLLPLDHDQPLTQAGLTILGPESAPGEVWFSCGPVGDHLYVLDAAGAKVIRFVSSAQGIFDVRDTSFSVPIPESARTSIYDFVPVPGQPEKLCEFLTSRWRYHRYFITTDGTAFSLSSELRTNLGSTRVGLRGAYSAGFGALVLQGPAGHVVRVEHAPAQAGPWTKLSSDQLSVQEPAFILVNLLSPLVAGEYLRVHDETTGTDSHVTRVPPAQPGIMAVSPVTAGQVKAGAKLTVYGGNWGSTPTVTFKEVRISSLGAGQVITHPVVPTSVSAGQIVLQMPPVTGRGYLELTVAGAKTTYWLTVGS